MSLPIEIFEAVPASTKAWAEGTVWSDLSLLCWQPRPPQRSQGDELSYVEVGIDPTDWHLWSDL